LNSKRGKILNQTLKVLVTGAAGFIGKNTAFQLERNEQFKTLPLTRETTAEQRRDLLNEADFICHMAGVNRPDDESEFARVNTDFTALICSELLELNKSTPIIFASSVHVKRNNAYGESKLSAENVLIDYSEKANTSVHIFRLPHVIGKWCRPNYNSVVATFCHNIARDLPIEISDPNFSLNIVYIDDLINSFKKIMLDRDKAERFCTVEPNFSATVGELATLIRSFKEGRKSLVIDRVGTKLERILYATYMSYLPLEDFSYGLTKHKDNRGVFVEMLKTIDSGQFSFFTAHPGITRGGHYHHTKTEKFLVAKGQARFGFRNIATNEFYEITTSGDQPQIVETIPGWAHDITNTGDSEMLVLLWANEIFDPENPDTYYCDPYEEIKSR
jgi:UDP-2-acetamido-2,6-beta-L-arabino-hexul-4-ose reductase